jgi:hypothetical protein
VRRRWEVRCQPALGGEFDCRFLTKTRGQRLRLNVRERIALEARSRESRIWVKHEVGATSW